MIASVAFRNFKALRATSLNLAPFNLLIGPNGSGKTSLIQALLRLRSLSRLPLSEVPAGARQKQGPEIAYRFSAPHDGIEARLGCVSDYACDLLQITPENAPGWPTLKTALGGIRSYLLDHYAMAEPAAREANLVLATNGSNLASVLAEMRGKAPAEFAALTAEFIRLLPEFMGIELTEQPLEKVELRLRLTDGEVVAAENLSQGTLYTLALLTLAYSPAAPTVACIEEVDRGIHPRSLREIRDVLYRLSYPAASGLARAPVQVIATTHSPYLLDLFREHPEEVVIAQKNGTEAHFERLADRADIGELLREGSLGDMWFSGILGGVPQERLP